MKKTLIGGLVGALILFIWQFLSWGVIDLHGSQMDYTPQQDQLMAAINAANLEEGDYFMPRAPRDASAEAQEAAMNEAEGSPWALLRYRKEMKNQMGMNMFRGFMICLVSVFLLGWLLQQFSEVTLSKAVIAALCVGMIGYMTNPYLNSVWFEGGSFPDLIDAVVPWAAIGAWMGWWTNR